MSVGLGVKRWGRPFLRFARVRWASFNQFGESKQNYAARSTGWSGRLLKRAVQSTQRLARGHCSFSARQDEMLSHFAIVTSGWKSFDGRCLVTTLEYPSNQQGSSGACRRRLLAGTWWPLPTLKLLHKQSLSFMRRFRSARLVHSGPAFSETLTAEGWSGPARGCVTGCGDSGVSAPLGSAPSWTWLRGSAVPLRWFDFQLATSWDGNLWQH